MDSQGVIAIFILVVIFYIIYSEWKRMMLKDLISKFGKRKMVYDELYAMLVLYQRRNSRMYIRCKEYDNALRHFITKGRIAGEFDKKLIITNLEHIQMCLVRDQIFSRNWFELPVDSLEIKTLLKDRKLIESLNNKDKNEQPNNTTSSKI